jgi:hypothetical protein
LEIPPVVANQKNEGQNVLQLAIRSRFKFIYRFLIGHHRRYFQQIQPPQRLFIFRQTGAAAELNTCGG